MTERLLHMQIEDGMVSFERDDGSTIIYPKELVPENFGEGDIIIAIVHSEDHIEFLELDTAETEARRARIAARAARIRARARRSTDSEVVSCIVDPTAITPTTPVNSEN